MSKLTISRSGLTAVSRLVKRSLGPKETGEYTTLSARIDQHDRVWVGSKYSAAMPVPSASITPSDHKRPPVPSIADVRRILTVMPDQQEFTFHAADMDEPGCYTDGPSVTFTPDQWSDLIGFNAPAVLAYDKDDPRSYLKGILFDRGCAVSTDGHRLHVQPMPHDLTAHYEKIGNRDAYSTTGPDVLNGYRLPAQILKAKRGSKDPVTLYFRGNHRNGRNTEVQILTNQMYFSAIMDSGKYPDYDRVIPDPRDCAYHIPITDRIRDAISRLAKDKLRTSDAIFLRVAGNEILSLGTTVLTEDPKRSLHHICDIPRREHVVWLDDLTEPVLIIAFNADYLNEAIGKPDSTTLHLIDATHYGRVDYTQEGRFAVIMPRRI